VYWGGNRRLAASAGLALLLAGCAEPAPPAARTLSLHRYAGKLRYLEANAPPGAHLLFDTGGGLTFLTPSAAESIGCVPYTQLTALRANGDRFEAEGCGPVQLSFDSLQVRPELGVFDLMALLPSGLPRLDGLASVATFAGRVLTIDLAHERLIVRDAVDPEEIRGASPLAIRLSHPFAGAGLDVFVRVDGARGPLWFELDSGDLDAVSIAPRVVDQLGLPAAEVAALGAGATREVELPIAGLGRVPLRAKAAEVIYDGVLDVDFVAGTLLVLDLPRALAWARRWERGEGESR
jgi:hypothetical protein